MFQVAAGEIFFAELDVIDVGARGLRNFFEQRPTAVGFTAGKLSAVGDVVEEQGTVARDSLLVVSKTRSMASAPSQYQASFRVCISALRLFHHLRKKLLTPESAKKSREVRRETSWRHQRDRLDRTTRKRVSLLPSQ